MTEWIPCGAGFIEADVIRWREAVWGPRNTKRRRPGKNVRIGDRLVIAEVLGDADAEGWVYLLIRGCDVVKVMDGRRVDEVPLLPKGKETKRKRHNLLRGKPERLLWSDETARALVASRFTGNKKPHHATPRKKKDEE